MSLTKRTWTSSFGSPSLTFTGSVTGATTKLTIVFSASSWITGITGSINVYVDGTKQSCTWTTNTTQTMMSTTYKTKMTSSQMTISKPFFTLKLIDTSDSHVIYEQMFSFYEIEKAATAATTSGGVMDGNTKSKVVFTTSVTDATYKATFTLGSYSGTATSSSKTLEYAIPISWCNALPNALTGTATVACQVLFGGQVYSTFSTTLSVSVPSSVKPTVSSITLSDKSNTPVPAAWNLFIQHQSGVKLSAVTCAGAYSSTIQSIKLQVGSQSTGNVTYSASSLPQISTITQSGTLTVTVTVTDSRGRTGNKTSTVTFSPYSAPKFTQCISERCNALGDDDNDGTYFKSTTTVEYSSCGGNNAVTMEMKYKKTDDVLFGTPVSLTPGVNVCGGNLDTEFSYDVVYTVSDQFRSVSYNDYVSTAVYLMHFLHGGRGVAFGQKATMQDWVDFNWKALFRKLCQFLGVVKFGTTEVDRVVINDTTKASPLMVDPNGAGTLYPVVLSNSPAFTGTPTAPTASIGTSTTQIATTAFVNNTVHKQATKIYDTKVTAADVSTTYSYTTISALANWNMVVIHCAVHNVQQNLVFMRPFTGGQLLSDAPTSGTYVRGGFVVDWTNNRVGIRCVNGNDTTRPTVYFDNVYGIF